MAELEKSYTPNLLRSEMIQSDNILVRDLAPQHPQQQSHILESTG